ncbi:MAG: SBBP repeat-containing protein, partial [Candidatus Thorarchaeota archaeon]
MRILNQIFSNTSSFFLIILLITITTFSVLNEYPVVTPSENKNISTNLFSINDYSKLPIYFEPNHGQVDNYVDFISRTNDYTLLLSQSEVTLMLLNSKGKTKNKKINFKILGSNPDSKIHGMGKEQGTTNYFLGADEKNWTTGVPNYSKVLCEDIYTGINLVYYGNKHSLEFDFIVAPGIDPGSIKLGFEGTNEISIDTKGNLILKADGGDVKLKSPIMYQEHNNIRNIIDGKFKLDDESIVSFKIDDYDTGIPLIIDPILVYSTYLGGSSSSTSSGITLDSQGNIYIAGSTRSLDFPTTNPFQPNLANDTLLTDVFITKFDPTGQNLIYSTYLGGSLNDVAGAIGVDAEGYVVVTGQTFSKNFPVRSAVQSSIADSSNDGDVFVIRINPMGNDIVYSTYLGSWDKDESKDLYVSADGNAYVTGRTFGRYLDDEYKTIFPLTSGAYKTTFGFLEDWVYFVSALNYQGNFIYSTLIPKTNYVESQISVDATGKAYLMRSGPNNTCDYKWVPNIIILNSTGSSIVDSISFCDEGYGFDLALDSKNNIYIIGAAWSNDMPTTANAFQSAFSGGQDVFLQKINSTGTSVLYSSFLGGSKDDWPQAISVPAEDKVFILGTTYSLDFPIKDAFESKFLGQYYGMFLSHFDLSKSGSESLVFSTFFGGKGTELPSGLTTDKQGNAYISGWTMSPDFPVKEAYQSTLNGVADAFICKIGSGFVNLIYDKVVIGGPPVSPLLLPPATQQILPQYLLNSVNDTAYFQFLGEKTDSRVGLRVTNTSFGFAPLYLNLSVTDPDFIPVPPFTIHNTGIGNAGIQFDVLKQGYYLVKVWCESNSPGPFPSPFQIHLAGNVGDPLKTIFPAGGNPYYEIERATRQDILVNHPAPRPQLLLGEEVLNSNNKAAQTALFKFTNLVQVSQNAVAVLIPTTDLGFPQGSAPVRAIDPNPIIDITTPTATTTQIVAPPRGTIIDFTQVPVPASLSIPLQLGVAAVLGISDQISTSLPFTNNTGDVFTIILDMGSGQEIINGEGSDFRIYAEGDYNVAVSNTPFQDTFIPIGSTVSGNNDFELASSGLTSARYVRINTVSSVKIDAIRALNVFADEVREDLGAFSKVSNTTITMRRSKAPETQIDPFLELIAPDGALMAKDESGFGDDVSTVLSDAALINMELNQEGFYRFLGR